MLSFAILCPRWDHIWLNEGFATYLSNIGCEAIYDRSFVCPFFYYFYQRGTMIMDVGAKLKEKTTVPSTSDILTYKDVQQIFIQYWRVLNRGACMLHMLRSMLGDEAFFTSITSYFTANAYSSTVSRDLWKHLEEPAKKSSLFNNTNLTIQSMMEVWVNNSGFPEVNVVTDFKRNLVTVYQYRLQWKWTLNDTKEAAMLWPLWMTFTTWGLDKSRDYTVLHSGGKLLPA